MSWWHGVSVIFVPWHHLDWSLGARLYPPREAYRRRWSRCALWRSSFGSIGRVQSRPCCRPARRRSRSMAPTDEVQSGRVPRRCRMSPTTALLPHHGARNSKLPAPSPSQLFSTFWPVPFFSTGMAIVSTRNVDWQTNLLGRNYRRTSAPPASARRTMFSFARSISPGRVCFRAPAAAANAIASSSGARSMR